MAARVPAGLTSRNGREFAFTVGTAFLVLAGVLVWRERAVAAWVAGAVALLLILAGALVPGRLGPIYRVWMGLAHAISRITTPVLLMIVYFGVMLPTGLLRRWLGGNPLVRPRGGTFWVSRPISSRRSDLTRQF